MMDFAHDNIDVAFRFGTGSDRGLYTLPLPQEWVTPVMTPAIAARFPTPESLRDAPLIFDGSSEFLTPKSDWAAWFRAMGVDFSPVHGPRFSQADHAIDAALAGAGVVMGRRALVVKDIADGRLVAPFGVALTIGTRFRFLRPGGAETRPQITAFQDWIVVEIEKTAALTDTPTLLAAGSL